MKRSFALLLGRLVVAGWAPGLSTVAADPTPSSAPSVVKALPAAVDATPELAQLDRLLAQGRAAELSAKWPESIAVYSQVLALEPGSFEALDMLATAYDASGQAVKARENYTGITALVPKTAQEHFYLADAYDALHQPEKAAPEYATAKAMPADDVFDLMLRGEYFLAVKDYYSALLALEQLLHRDPACVEALGYRALVNCEVRQYDAAIADCNAAIRLKPDFAAAYNNLGYTYSAMKKYELAVKSYDEAIRLCPGQAISWKNRGEAYRELKQYDLSLRDLDEAIRLSPNAYFFEVRGTTLFRMSKKDLALKDLEEAIQLDPKAVSPRFNLAFVYSSEGKPELALQALDEAIRLDPKDAKLYVWRAGAYRQLRRDAEAQQDDATYHMLKGR